MWAKYFIFKIQLTLVKIAKPICENLFKLEVKYKLGVYCKSRANSIRDAMLNVRMFFTLKTYETRCLTSGATDFLYNYSREMYGYITTFAVNAGKILTFTLPPT